MPPMTPQNQPAIPPAGPAASPAPHMPPAAGTLPGAPMVAPNPAAQASAAAREALAHHSQDPYALAEALQRIKAEYVATTFQVSPNSVEQ